MRKKITLFLTYTCLCLTCLCACGKKQEVKENKIHVGVLCYDQSDTFINELLGSFKQQFENDGIDAIVSIYDAEGQARKQGDQLKELIDEDCDVWCINLVDRTNPSEVIDAGKENNVPIIFFNREPVAEDMKQWDKLYYVGAEAKQSGIIQGELAADMILKQKDVDRNHDGKIQYVVLEGEPGHQDSIIRTENAVNFIKNNQIQLEKLSSGISNWNRAQAQNRMQQFIEQYDDKIELVLANNDSMALGAIDAYESLNFKKKDYPIIFGVDGTKEGLYAVKAGKLSGTVYNDKEGQAQAMEKLTIALAWKEGLSNINFTNDNYIYLKYYKIDKNNVDEYIAKLNDDISK